MHKNWKSIQCQFRKRLLIFRKAASITIKFRRMCISQLETAMILDDCFIEGPELWGKICCCRLCLKTEVHLHSFSSRCKASDCCIAADHPPSKAIQMFNSPPMGTHSTICRNLFVYGGCFASFEHFEPALSLSAASKSLSSCSWVNLAKAKFAPMSGYQVHAMPPWKLIVSHRKGI